MNRPPLSDKNIEQYFPVLKRKANLLRQNEGQRKPVAVLKRPNQLNRKITFQLILPGVEIN